MKTVHKILLSSILMIVAGAASIDLFGASALGATIIILGIFGFAFGPPAYLILRK